MMGDQPLICVVDDDESVREALPDLIREFGFLVRAFESAEDFLASGCPGHAHCLVLDMCMPGMSGLDLQRELARRSDDIPIVFITAHKDAAVRPPLGQRGPIQCLLKPFSDTALLKALRDALAS